MMSVKANLQGFETQLWAHYKWKVADFEEIMHAADPDAAKTVPSFEQEELTQIKTNAETADHEFAVAVRAATQEIHVDQTGHPTSAMDSECQADANNAESDRERSFWTDVAGGAATGALAGVPEGGIGTVPGAILGAGGGAAWWLFRDAWGSHPLPDSCK